MNRRFFIASATAAAAASLAACSTATTSATPTPSQDAGAQTSPPQAQPPSPGAVPNAFGQAPSWQGASILAVHDQYLVGTAWPAAAVGVTAQGLCPVVVDLSTNATTAVLPDGSGGFRTEQVSLDPDRYTQAMQGNLCQDGSTVPYTHAPAALLDHGSAYIIVGLSQVQASAEALSQCAVSDGVCPVSVVKVNLSDGSLAASRRVSEAFSVKLLASRSALGRDLALSFNTDCSALLLAGSSFGASDFLGLRLSTQDLSTEMDVHDLLDDPSGYTVESYGQAVLAKATLPRTDSFLLMLANGASQAQASGIQLVRDGWCYYADGSQVLATSLETDKTLTIHLDPTQAQALSTAWPRISSDSCDLVLSGPDLFKVLRPGQPSPLLGWEASQRPTPAHATVMAEVAYTMPADASVRHTTIELLSLANGQTLATLRSQEGWVPCLAVSSWGMACDLGAFYPATGWFDSNQETS